MEFPSAFSKQRKGRPDGGGREGDGPMEMPRQGFCLLGGSRPQRSSSKHSPTTQPAAKSVGEAGTNERGRRVRTKVRRVPRQCAADGRTNSRTVTEQNANGAPRRCCQCGHGVGLRRLRRRLGLRRSPLILLLLRSATGI